MALSADIITVGVPQGEAARAFYASAFSSTATATATATAADTAAGDDHTAGLDLHGTGQLALHQIDALATAAHVWPPRPNVPPRRPGVAVTGGMRASRRGGARGPGLDDQ